MKEQEMNREIENLKLEVSNLEVNIRFFPLI